MEIRQKTQTIHGDDGVRTTGLNEHNDTGQMPFLSHPNGRSREIWLQISTGGGRKNERNSSREQEDLIIVCILGISGSSNWKAS